MLVTPLLPWLVIVIGAVLAVAVAYLADRLDLRASQCWPPERLDNGIRVGAPKVYDNRSLSLMLEELQNQLKALQSIDASALKTSLGTRQGETTSNLGLSANVVVTPVAATAAPPATQPPAGPAATAPLAVNERAADLLDDQVNLSYQIFNLRLLLERAISDRLTDDFSPRVQAVIALPISIDAPPYAVGCAATVEVTLTVEGVAEPERRPSLVALFPQEETYNTWNVSGRSMQLSASGVAGTAAGSAGISGSRSASALRRQADVVALEREAGPRELIVQWQFRPGSGERTVKAGLRQVMAVLALPNAAAGVDELQVRVRVRSAWQSWNAASATVGDGAGWRALFSDRPTWHTFGEYERTARVPAARVLEEKLAPIIDSIEWYRVGPQRACVTVNGRNFFTGMTAVMGDAIVGTDNGLTIKSEQALQLVVPVTALLNDALLNGRYGQSIELARAPTGTSPLKISGVWFDPKPGNQSFELVVDLAHRDGTPLSPEQLFALPEPILAINGTVLASGLQYDFLTPGKSVPSVTGRVLVTADILTAVSLTVSVRWPFFGPAWSLRYQTYTSAGKLAVARSTSGSTVALLISGRDFTDEVRVVLDQAYALDPNGPLTRVAEGIFDVLELKVDQSVVDQHHELLVWEVNRATVVVPIPAGSETSAPAIDASKKPPVVKAKTGCSVDFSGTGLGAVTAVRLNGTPQQFVAYADGNAIGVVIDGASIPASGTYELDFETKTGRPLTATLVALDDTPLVHEPPKA